MHCEQCNTDFPEGLRYCKWCGGPLVNRPRITSELHACPKCSAAIQPGWTFCKACGERLHASRNAVGIACPNCGAPTEPGAQTCVRCGEELEGREAPSNPQEFVDTARMVKCSTCGERLDTGSLYCKACGSAAYTEETQSGTTVQQKAPTLPDLDEQMASRQPVQPDFNSGANTWALTVTDSEEQTAVPRPKAGADTSMLPGTAGARSEQQSPTAIIDMGRITGPVEETNEVRQPALTSAELRPAAALTSAELRLPGAENGLQQPAIEPVEPAEVKKPATGDFGSESGNSASSPESKTEIFVSPFHPPPPPPSPPISQDGIGTMQFVQDQSLPGKQGSREIPPAGPPPNLDPLKTTVQKAYVPEAWTPAPPPIDPSATRELSQPETSSLPIEQVSSKPQPAVAAWPVEQVPSQTQPEVPAWPVEHVPSQAPPQKRTGMMIASVLVVLIVVGGAAYAGWWFLFARVRPAPPVVVVEQPPTPPPVVTTTPEKPPTPVVPDGMVSVAAGSYTIGRDDADPLEQPRHKVTLPAFFIDRTEVTNAAYKQFLDATGHKAPTNWTGRKPPEGREKSPVTGVTWQDAADYATWAGKRLPTEIEWEAAARGAEGRIYPWGNDYRKSVANIGSKPDDITADQYPSGLKEVGQYPLGASAAGAVDMIGNAWEWAADEFALYPGGIAAIPKDIKDRMKPGLTYRIIRGGAYDGNKEHDATYRGLLDASQAYPKVGFRCAKDAK